MSLRFLKSLIMKSAKIQQMIEDENKRKWPDTFRLLKLKKIRLTIKDKIFQLTRGHKLTPRLVPIKR